MIKRELAIKIARRTGAENHVVEKFVDAFIDEVIAEVKTGGKVHMRGFGTFETVVRKQKIGRLLNGKSGGSKGAVVIHEHRKPRFKAGDYFNNTVREA